MQTERMLARATLTVILLGILAMTIAVVQAQQANMTFFVTSTGKGSADFGGLEGADAHCSTLAKAAGAKATKAPNSATAVATVKAVLTADT